jgi:hypothetical protein
MAVAGSGVTQPEAALEARELLAGCRCRCLSWPDEGTTARPGTAPVPAPDDRVDVLLRVPIRVASVSLTADDRIHGRALVRRSTSLLLLRRLCTCPGRPAPGDCIRGKGMAPSPAARASEMSPIRSQGRGGGIAKAIAGGVPDSAQGRSYPRTEQTTGCSPTYQSGADQPGVLVSDLNSKAEPSAGELLSLSEPSAPPRTSPAHVQPTRTSPPSTCKSLRRRLAPPCRGLSLHRQGAVQADRSTTVTSCGAPLGI